MSRVCRPRGFTLLELMVTLGCLGLATAAAYELGFTVRQQLRVGEVDLTLTRDAALIEHTWRRDVRGARSLGAEGAGEGVLAVFDAGTGREVRWSVVEGRLLRRDPKGEVLLAPAVERSAVRRDGALVTLEVELAGRVGDLVRRQPVRAVAGAPGVVR